MLFKSTLVPEILNQVEVVAGSPPPNLFAPSPLSVPYSVHLGPHLGLPLPRRPHDLCIYVPMATASMHHCLGLLWCPFQGTICRRSKSVNPEVPNSN